MTSTADAPKQRLSSDERRAQILLAALAVFGAKGYHGATTDDVARAASVSQPYVVRLFGSKEALFLEALDEAVRRLFDAFTASAEEAGAEDGALERCVGHGYINLLQVRGLHQTLSHAFLLGAHPVIGPRARDCYARVWQFLRDLGLDADRAEEFLARGMLLNTIIGLRLADDYDSDPRVADMFTACFPTEKATVLRYAPRVDEGW